MRFLLDRYLTPFPAVTAKTADIQVSERSHLEKLFDRYETRYQQARDSLGAWFYVGFDPVTGRKVALYQMSDSFLDERVQRDLSAAMTLRHPHVVNIINLGTSPRQIHGEYGNEAAHLLVMELFEGQSLRDTMKIRRRLQDWEVLSTMAGILAAAACLHDHKLDIGHIRPERVLSLPDGTVRLMHHFIEEHYRYDGPIITRSNFWLYTQPMSAYSDERSAWCYSLGIVLQEMLTGLEPAQYRARDNGPFFSHTLPPPPSTLVQGCSDFDGVIAKAMAERPEQRYATPRDFAAALGIAL